MAALVIAEHDNSALKDSTQKTVTAAKALGGDVHVLVAGQNAQAVANAAAGIDGVSSVLLADDALYANGLAEPLAALIVKLAPGYDAILAPATTSGKNVLPQLLALLDVPPTYYNLYVAIPYTFLRPI